ncbi:adenylyltransferase/cytidyltransferase family protein [Propioniciclava soli]|uniref:adenylyltransferase/cytidyltransferase family protein n=1 Tax=Propioniciclava soli TaxID=2775081 RepID=UPI001E543FBC
MTTVRRWEAPRPGVVGYVPGAWDMFHIGHLNILRRAREYCDTLVVGVTDDHALLTGKGRAPIIPEHERLEIVTALSIVDHAILDHSFDKRDAWRAVHFDVLFKGDDWRGTVKGRQLEEQMAEVGARVHYFPYTVHTSSTHLRRAIGAL